MADLDPYAILGVPRTATRVEIARSYRALAKRHHPDAGAPPSPTMARINEAWYVLSDATRRARWDRANTVVAPPHWSPGPGTGAGREAPVYRRPVAAPRPEPGPADRGWVVASIVTGVAVLLAGVMAAIWAVTAPADTRASFADEHLTFQYPTDWTLMEGEPGQDPAHEVLAHLVSFPIDSDERCTRFPADPCGFGPNGVPPGQASLVITAREGGPPPVPEPVIRRPFGLDADALIGGKPAAIEVGRTAAGSLDVWWQLSPPGFPDRWIEIRGELGGQEQELELIQGKVQELIDSIEFVD